MTAQAKWAVPQSLLDLPQRTFATLGRDETARLAVLLRPLPWIDGLITAAILAPEETDDWIEHIWVEDELGKTTLAQANDVVSMVDDQFSYVAGMLFDHPQAYRPFLDGASDEQTAAAQWAAGFRFGVRLQPEPWMPLIDDADARLMLMAIFSLERDEDQPEEARAKSPFRDIPADRREQMRRDAVPMLPALVCALNEFSVALEADEFDCLVGDEARPYTRTTPKIGRNEPCPCGSGKKYKKCCLGETERDFS